MIRAGAGHAAAPSAEKPTSQGLMGSGSAQVETREKTMRELWEEEQEALKNAPRAPLEMGRKRMCEIGGCGYFSDDDK